MSSRSRRILMLCPPLALSGALVACTGDSPPHSPESADERPSHEAAGALSSPSCQPAIYDAASMLHSLGNAIPEGWTLWGNGYVSTNHSFTAGPTTITVSAKGTSAAGVWPHMVVSVDGTPIGDGFVSAASFTDYSFPFNATAGTQSIRVTFDNDLVQAGEDRNLFLAKLTVACGVGGDACEPTTCAAYGKDCGDIPDGCGGTLSCGACGAGLSCGGAGVANVCGAAPASPPAGAALRIMPLGDSITLGVNGGYRNGLWTRLTNAGRTVDFVGTQSDPFAVAPDKNHEGHPGFSVGDLAANTDEWMAATAPSYALLMIGTNDVAWWCAKSPGAVAAQTAALIDQILAARPGIWVVVASIPPLVPTVIPVLNVDRAKLAKDYNKELKKRVHQRIKAGKQVRFADVHSALTVADLYDGVHPTQAASDKIAEVWFDALAPILP